MMTARRDEGFQGASSDQELPEEKRGRIIHQRERYGRPKDRGWNAQCCERRIRGSCAQIAACVRACVQGCRRRGYMGIADQLGQTYRCTLGTYLHFYTVPLPDLPDLACVCRLTERPRGTPVPLGRPQLAAYDRGVRRCQQQTPPKLPTDFPAWLPGSSPFTVLSTYPLKSARGESVCVCE